jgi:hypothetical protein
MNIAAKIVVILTVASVLIFIQFTPALAQTDADPLLTDSLERISWGAVLAGAVVALIVQFALNLLGFAVGVSSINPEFETDSIDPKGLGLGATLWVTIGAFISLFVGGWIAAHMAGIPDETDGMLHGIVMWSLVSLVSLLFLATGIGRVMSGVGTLLGHTLSLTAQVADTTATTATTVAGATLGAGASVAGAAANVATDAARTAGNLAQDAADSATDAAATVADKTTDKASDVASTGYEKAYEYAPRTAHQLEKMWHEAQDLVSQAPDVVDAEEVREMAWDAIRQEAYKVARQSEVNPNEAQYQAEEVVDDAQRALRYMANNPAEADATLMWLLRRVFRRGETVVDDADREALIDALMERAPISREEAESYINQWEETYNSAKEDVQSAREQAMNRVEEMQEKAKQKFNEMQDEANQRLKTLRHEAEERARDAAQATTEAIAAIAAAIFIAMLAGALAAGIGGAVGVPDAEDVPADEVDEEASLQAPPLTTFEVQ